MDFNLQSECVNELFDALSKAQGQFTFAPKNKKNPFFKSSYADLASVIDSCKEALAENGLCYIQCPYQKEGIIYLVTTLAHKSGQWIRSYMPLIPKNPNEPQSIGSMMTYFRRYCLAAILGIAQDDDDGNEASLPSRSSISLSEKSNHSKEVLSRTETSDNSTHLSKLEFLLNQDKNLKQRVITYFTQQGYPDYSKAPLNMIVQSIVNCEKSLNGKSQAMAV